VSTSLILEQLAVGVSLQLLGLLAAMWLFKWRKHEESPEKMIADLKEAFEQWRMDSIDEMRQLNEKLTKVRASNARIRGILNGHGWKTSPEED